MKKERRIIIKENDKGYLVEASEIETDRVETYKETKQRFMAKDLKKAKELITKITGDWGI